MIGFYSAGAMMGVDSDPYWPYVGSLLHFNGTDGSTDIFDETGRPWSVTGNSQIDTSVFKFGGGSLLLDGAGDYISSTPIPLGSGDWTVECCVRRNSARTMMVYDNWVNGTANTWAIAINASGQPYLFTSNGGPSVVVLLASGAPIAVDEMAEICFSRAGGITRAFVRGALSGQVADARNYNGAAPSLAIGAQVNSRNSAYDFSGHIDESRITVGVGRYSASYTPADSEFPNPGAPTVYSPAAVTTSE